MNTFGAVRPSGVGEAERRGAERRRILVTLAPLGILALACCALVLSGGSDSHAEVRSCKPTHPSVSTCCWARSLAALPLRTFVLFIFAGLRRTQKWGLALDRMLVKYGVMKGQEEWVGGLGGG